MGPKDRGERQLMRQRGAGTRQVKNIGFDLVLPGQEKAATEPLQPIKSGRSRKTPQPELPPQRSSRRTPKPEKTQLQRSSRKTLATGVTKKRGRPTKKTDSDELLDQSTSRVAEADQEGTTTKKRKTSKVQTDQADAVISDAPEVQGDELGTTETTPSAAPSNRVKKRKKRKSIGQQSISRAKATKARSPLKPARQPRKRIPKPDLAEATDRDESLAKEVRKETLFNAVPLDGGEPADSSEVAGVLDYNVEPSAEKPQEEIAERPKKRKRVPVEEPPKKRVKASSTQSKRAPKDPKTQKDTTLADNTLNAVQNMEKPAETEAGFLDDVIEEQETASDAAEPLQEKPRKRKRVTVGQQRKKRSEPGIPRTYREPKDQGKTSTTEDGVEATQSVGKPAEVQVGSIGHAEEPEATAEEVERQVRKPKRKKRKSIGQQKPKKKSMDLATLNRTASKVAASGQLATRDELRNKPIARRGRPRAKRPPEEANEEPQSESLGHVPDQGDKIQPSQHRPKKIPKARRGRPKTKPISEDAVDEPDEEALRQTPEEDENVQAPAFPEKKKRGRPRKVDATQPTSQTIRPKKAPASRKLKPMTASTAAPKPRAPPKNSIPITIYGPPSPTSSDAEDDPLSTSLPPTTSNTINAVDVLSQLCSELLSKSSSTLAEQARSDPSSAKQTELKRKKQTTDLYAEELASRLLHLTTTLNTNTSLQSRVRAAAKEERSLKTELKQLEKEREELKVRKEKVLKEKKKRELEELLSGIAGAVKRGWDMQKEGEEGDAVAGMVEEVDSEI